MSAALLREKTRGDRSKEERSKDPRSVPRTGDRRSDGMVGLGALGVTGAGGSLTDSGVVQS